MKAPTSTFRPFRSAVKWRALACASLTFGLLACAQPAREPVTHTVTIDGMQYQPAALTVRVGDTIVWVNTDPFPHTITSSPAGAFDSGDVAAGASWQFTARTAGAFPYLCKYHPTMTGTLTVE
jgi:plastocyanin